MKSTRVALLAALGMFLTSVSVYSLTPPGGFRSGPGSDAPARPDLVPEEKRDAPAQTDMSHFTDGKTVTIEGRVGHAKLATTGAGETFVMLEAKAADGVRAQARAPVNLALVPARASA
jgi:Ca-activated chloride channel family protein